MTTRPGGQVSIAAATPNQVTDFGVGREGPDQAGFQWRTSVFFDDLDAMGMLHNAGYLVLVERATSAFFEARGWRWEKYPALNPDQFYVVQEQSVQYRE
ncbi:MAG: acyl-CoA thioesterase, partial [Acidimicrobiales bacterium]